MPRQLAFAEGQGDGHLLLHTGCNASTRELSSLRHWIPRQGMVGGMEYFIREGGKVEGTLENEANRAREL